MNNNSLYLDVADIIGDSVVDGPGLRTVVFCQGCVHNCPGCHNPQSHEFGVGTKFSVQETYEKIRSNKLCKGVTFSGGEPFCQPEAFSELAKLLREHGYEVACYTGYIFEKLLNSNDKWKKELLNNIHILIDGPFLIDKLSLQLRFKGSENQRIIDVQKSLKSGAVVLASDGRWDG